MIGTSHRGPVRRSVFHPEDPTGSQGASTIHNGGRVYERQPAPGLPPFSRLYTGAGRQVVKHPARKKGIQE
ncbi:unnamed protein product, partial [Staurois parvus]